MIASIYALVLYASCLDRVEKRVEMCQLNAGCSYLTIISMALLVTVNMTNDSLHLAPGDNWPVLGTFHLLTLQA